MDSRTLTARWIFPVSGPPLSCGTITLAGTRIVAVEAHGTRSADEDLGNVAILPGLGNPHTHLDLSGALGQTPPTDADHFPDWLRSVIAFRRSRTSAQVESDIAFGLAQAQRFGTTMLGDISADGASWSALSAAPIRAVVFREFLGLSQSRRDEATNRATQWLAETHSTPTCRVGLSPHAPYSVRRGLFGELGKLCEREQIPMAIHLAESQAECDLLEHRQGPFVDFLQGLGLWSEAEFEGDFASVITSTDYGQPRLFIHGNHLSPTAPLTRGSSLVICPRTHAAFRHPPHPFRHFLSRESQGIRVCLGTDSLASNPDLDPLAEARFLHEQQPDLPGELLLRMITILAAESLGFGEECGSLEAGKSADLVTVPLTNQDASDPYDLLWSATPNPRRTMFQGQWRSEPN